MTVPDDPGEGQSTEPVPRGRSRDLRLVATGVLLALGVWFALANTQEVKIRFWVVDTRSPVVAALVIAAVFGAGIGALLARHSARFPRGGPGGAGEAPGPRFGRGRAAKHRTSP